MASTAPGFTLKSSGTLQKEKTSTQLWDICIHGAVRSDGIVHHKKEKCLYYEYQNLFCRKQFPGTIKQG